MGFGLHSLDDAQRVYVKNPIPIFQPIAAQKARIYLKQGRLDKAHAWVHERKLSVKDEASYLGEYEHLTLARTRLFEGSFTGIHELLERLLTLAETQKRTGSVIEIVLTQALVHQAQGNPTQALAALERALTLAEPEGYLRIFVDEGESMRLLILDFKSKIEKQGNTRPHSLFGYVTELLAAFPQPMESIPNPKHLHIHNAGVVNQKPKIIKSLTDRELEILRLVAEGHTNTEISQRLYLALSTVKGHNLRIFNKLQAQNRTEAVVRARELGLL